jgi:hypothetical protein
MHVPPIGVSATQVLVSSEQMRLSLSKHTAVTGFGELS